MAAVLAAGLRAAGVEVVHEAFFDTVQAAGARAGRTRWPTPRTPPGIALRRVDADTVGIACSELTTVAHLRAVWAAFGVAADVGRAGRGRPTTRCPARCGAAVGVPDPPGVPRAPLGDRR